MTRGRRHWMFDMDGTLTRPMHDFEAIRQALGIPAGEPILEYLRRQPAERRRRLNRRLDEIEMEIAGRAEASEDAERVLAALAGAGARLGIVTRNSETIAHETLRVAGLDHFFDANDVIGRESAAPKPQPDGLLMLLGRWGAARDDAVMIGDYLYDLLAGRAAGVMTVHVDASGRFPWPEHADLCVRTLDALVGGDG